MPRIVVTPFLFAALALLVAGPAWAGPETATLQPLLPKTEKPSTLFGYAGKRPLDPGTRSGIARTTTPPRIETAAFGAAVACLPVRPRMAPPSPAPDLGGVVSQERRIVVSDCAGGSCSPCAPYCPTTRVNDDPLSISPHQWSSGYHDGNEVRHCDPCAPCASRPIYRSPCEPCTEPCDPRAPCVVVRRPARVVRYAAAPACGPCYAPYRGWCGPRVRVGFAPYWGWGLGWGAGASWARLGLGWRLLVARPRRRRLRPHREGSVMRCVRTGRHGPADRPARRAAARRGRRGASRPPSRTACG